MGTEWTRNGCAKSFCIVSVPKTVNETQNNSSATGSPRRRLVAWVVLALLVAGAFGGYWHYAHPPQAPQSEPVIIRNVDDWNRVYAAAVEIINPFMRLHDKPEKKVTKDAAQQIKRGIEMLDAVTTYRPGWSAFWVKGKAHQALDDSKAACAAFKSAFALQDKNPDVAREYMLECLKLGEGAEGVRVARHAVTLDPSDAGLHAGTGHRRQAQGGIGSHR